MTTNFDVDKKQLIIVKSLIINDGKVLMVRRNREWHKEAHGKWEFPGGKIDFGESPEMAAVREAKEESGYDVKVIRMLPLALSYKWEYEIRSSHIILVCYLCKLIGGEKSLNDTGVSEVKWFTIDEISKLECLPGIKEFIVEYQKSA